MAANSQAPACESVKRSSIEAKRLVSRLRRPDKAMLVLGNLNDNEIETQITLDLHALKVQLETVTLFDGKTTAPARLDNGAIRVKIRAKSPLFILINS